MKDFLLLDEMLDKQKIHLNKAFEEGYKEGYKDGYDKGYAEAKVEQEPKTQMVDKSNFDVEQYKMDLQCAYDCGARMVEPKTGHWKPTIVRGSESYICSECLAECCYVTTSYCPTCGARMESEVEE